MPIETEQQRLQRLDRLAGARGRVPHSGPKAAFRHLKREEDDADRAEAANKAQAKEAA